MRVIGFDPGLVRAGYAVVEDHAGRVRSLEHGTIHAAGESPAEQLAHLRTRLQHVITAFQPELMAIERIFFNRNARTAVRVIQSSGVATCLAAEEGLGVYEYGPLEVKAAVVGVGDATKDQVSFMVTRILGLKTEPDSPDAADALALGICLLHSRPWVLEGRAAR